MFEGRSHDLRLRSTLKRDTGCVFIFEKLRFRDGLVWTAGLTVEIKLAYEQAPGRVGFGER